MLLLCEHGHFFSKFCVTWCNLHPPPNTIRVQVEKLHYNLGGLALPLFYACSRVQKIFLYKVQIFLQKSTESIIKCVFFPRSGSISYFCWLVWLTDWLSWPFDWLTDCHGRLTDWLTVMAVWLTGWLPCPFDWLADCHGRLTDWLTVMANWIR